MRCPVCGLEIEEATASFCPRCGTLLIATETEPSHSGAPPANSIHRAPTRISADGPPPRRGAWGSSYRQPSASEEMPPTHASLYGQAAADQPPAAPRLRPARPMAPPGRPTRRLWLILGSIIILAAVFASGVGVAIVVLGARGQQTPATNAASPTSALSATPTPIEKVIFTDPLTSPANPWPVDTGHCQFKNGSYQVIADYICFAPIGVQSNVAISVQVKQFTSTTNAFFGLTFRYTSRGNYYNFLINSNSLWSFSKYVNNQGTAIVSEKADPAIKVGLNTTNTLLVRMLGSHIDFFVNGVKIGAADDATYSAGLIGLQGAENAAVAFNNFQVATLS